MQAKDILDKYILFFEKRGHARIENSSLVPLNDPTTLFTSSGMQPLVPFLLGETHPHGKQLVNVQNCFRAQDIEEVGDNRHTTFFRMLGNWSLGNYFKKEQIPWFFEFLTDIDEGLGLPAEKLYVTVFSGFNSIEKDTESENIWKGLFESKGISLDDRISSYGVDKNWWSRSGTPDKMPVGEPGGPDSEVFFDFGENLGLHEVYEKTVDRVEPCHVNCDCGRYLEIGNSVFMQFQKQEDGSFKELPQRNVDFGGGLERLLAAAENKQDIFETSLFLPIINSIAAKTGKSYKDNAREMRIIVDHFVAAVFITANGIVPSNKEHGYILRRLIRRGLDNFYLLEGKNISPIIESIIEQYKDTDSELTDKFEVIKNVILEEEQKYSTARAGAIRFVEKKYRTEQKDVSVKAFITKEISAEDAFILYSTHGLSPTQIKSLGYTFNDSEFAEKIKEHQQVSRKGAGEKFAGGLADASDLTVKGHTATHLMQQALRDILGDSVHQTGSNITVERVRFDFSFDRKLTEEEIKKVEEIVREKIDKDLAVNSAIMKLDEAKKLGAIGLFDEKYGDRVKIYAIGGDSDDFDEAYSKEFCGGPHVEHTGQIISFAIIKEEGIARGVRRIYAKVS